MAKDKKCSSNNGANILRNIMDQVLKNLTSERNCV